MTYVAGLDISSFIWNEIDFNQNEAEYFVMMDRMMNLQDKLTFNKAHVLLRAELYEQIMIEFPHSLVSTRFYDFTRRTLTFLSDLGERMELYPAHTFSITSEPNLLKAHFSQATASEVQYLINRMHSQSKPDIIFFTYEYLWTTGNLKTSYQQEEIEHETLVGDDLSGLEEFFSRYRPTFEHNSKHDRIHADGYISGLSCYNERNKDKTLAQALLNSAKKNGDFYYNYDLLNDVWVVFRPTRKNIYHGHDELNANHIPTDIRRHFSK